MDDAGLLLLAITLRTQPMKAILKQTETSFVVEADDDFVGSKLFWAGKQILR